ncbi:homocysteine S-methyltransferase [Actinomyces sp. 2119]|uniref:homocysteine S-methyltransferase n=1 Tax=Actinomyces sp. 2119 TaxID=2321393 RepID=UPI000E6C416B|nr:homocysteine S-methyltransferase [Actinomyces sp. 2119]RJF42580.1 homocysteine S-methyltransferase [Actinomyces sp. 2119]
MSSFPGAGRLAGPTPPTGPGPRVPVASSLAGALASGTLVLDGAMGTELQARGVDTSRTLWSAQALLDAPGAVTEVHAAYLAAGADVIETNSYQASVPALTDVGYDEAGARDLIASSARLALAAAGQAATARGGPAGTFGSAPGRSQGGGTSLEEGEGAGHPAPGERPRPFVAGALGPYGAFLADGSEYTGAYEVSQSQLERVHRPRIEALAAQGLTVFALETMPRLDEARLVTTVLAQTAPGAECWVSFQVRPDGAHLADGTPLAQAAAWADTHPAVVAVGLNCVAPETVARALPVLRRSTAKPLVAYPNSGDSYDPVTKTWTPVRGTGRFTALVPEWVEAGVRLVGGCCRTTPDDTAVLAGAIGAARGSTEDSDDFGDDLFR